MQQPILSYPKQSVVLSAQPPRPIMNDTALLWKQYLATPCDRLVTVVSKDGPVVLELGHVFSRYDLDVLTSCNISPLGR
jgi:hypothetical protein